MLRQVGGPLALSPKFQFNARVNYKWETGSGLKPFVNLAFHHVGKSWSDVIDNVDKPDARRITFWSRRAVRRRL